MKTLLTVALTLALATSASASVPLTTAQAKGAAQLALENSLGALAYRSVGAAPTRITSCRVRGRRAVCYGTVRGSELHCAARVRVLLAGHLPASDPDATLIVWADRIRCR